MKDQVIESFKRLYKAGRINESTLDMILKKGSITQEDKEYIMKKDGE